MNRLWIGIVLLAVFLLGGIASGMIMEKIYEPVIQQLEQASEGMLQGKTEQAIATAQKARESWDKMRCYTAAVSSHEPLEEIDSLFVQLPIYAQTEDTAHFAAYCVQLASLIRTISEAQQFNWWNFL